MKNILDKRYLYVNGLMLGLGIIFGIIFLIFTSNIDKLYITNEINEYFINLKNLNNVNLYNVLISFKSNILSIITITISSIIFILSPLILFINFYKGMQIGFLISSIILTFNAKGIIYSVVSLFPHHILFCILIIIYSSIMFTYSIKLLNATKENKNLNIKLFIKRVGILFIGASITTLIISLLEIYLNSFLMNLII